MFEPSGITTIIFRTFPAADKVVHDLWYVCPIAFGPALIASQKSMKEIYNRITRGAALVSWREIYGHTSVRRITKQIAN